MHGLSWCFCSIISQGNCPQYVRRTQLHAHIILAQYGRYRWYQNPVILAGWPEISPYPVALIHSCCPRWRQKQMLDACSIHGIRAILCLTWQGESGAMYAAPVQLQLGRVVGVRATADYGLDQTAQIRIASWNSEAMDKWMKFVIRKKRCVGL